MLCDGTQDARGTRQLSCYLFLFCFTVGVSSFEKKKEFDLFGDGRMARLDDLHLKLKGQPLSNGLSNAKRKTLGRLSCWLFPFGSDLEPTRRLDLD